MAYTTINKSSLHFNTKTWTGTGSSNAITGVGFQPDFCWVKQRSGTENHFLNNAIQGSTKVLQSDTSAAEQTSSNGMTAFGADGFTVNTDTGFNGNGSTYVSWNWKANGAGSSNSDGSVTSTVSANTTSGFSIVKFDPTGAACTIGHGLGVAPKVIIAKALNRTFSWVWGGDAIGWTKYLELNETQAVATSTARWNDTAPTSTVFSVKNEYNSGDNAIAYCFAEKTGYSKFGSYTGNGNADGPFIYTGFKPQFILWKRTDSANGWILMDTKRSPFNVVDDLLEAQSNGAEATASSYYVDYLSNGFKIRNTNNVFNNSSGTYIFMAFAEAPLVGSNNVPATAR
jgi:hypothetical protein